MTTPPTIEERVSRLEGGAEHWATKADVESVRVDLERLRADVTAEIGSVRAELKEEIGSVRAELKAEIRDSKISTILWLTGIMAGLTAAQIGAVVALLRTLGG